MVSMFLMKVLKGDKGDKDNKDNKCREQGFFLTNFKELKKRIFCL